MVIVGKIIVYPKAPASAKTNPITTSTDPIRTFLEHKLLI